MKYARTLAAAVMLAAVPGSAVSAASGPAEQMNGKCLFIFPIIKFFGYQYLPCQSGAADRF